VQFAITPMSSDCAPMLSDYACMLSASRTCWVSSQS